MNQSELRNIFLDSSDTKMNFLEGKTKKELQYLLSELIKIEENYKSDFDEYISNLDTTIHFDRRVLKLEDMPSQKKFTRIEQILNQKIKDLQKGGKTKRRRKNKRGKTCRRKKL